MNIEVVQSKPTTRIVVTGVSLHKKKKKRSGDRRFTTRPAQQGLILQPYVLTSSSCS